MGGLGQRFQLLFLANARSVHTVKWVNAFARSGHEVHVVTWHPSGASAPLDEMVQLHRVLCPPHYLARYGTLLEVMRVVHRVKPDLIHAHFLSHFGVVGGLLARTTGFHPLVLTAWGTRVFNSVGTKRKLVSLAVRQADCVTCDSPHMVNRLVALGTPPEVIQVINFGVDTDLFAPRRPSGILRAELALALGPVVISLRKLERVYDVATLLRAIPLVLHAFPHSVFIVAGDGDERESLQSLAKVLGVWEHVRFIGIVQNNQLPEYLNLSDVYVSTSLSDAGIAASTAEAMACGLPAVVTDFGDNGSWVRDGQTGYLFPCGDHKRLAERLILLLGNQELRERLGSNARREIVERNSYQVEMRKMERIYEALIERNRT